MTKYDVVIIGGGPAGLTAALSAKNTYPKKSVALIRREKVALIPCGIPYIFGTLEKVEDNIMPDAPLQKNNVAIIIDEVVDRNDHVLVLKNGEEITYSKLILATGSRPFIPPIPGIEHRGVYFIKKDMEYLRTLKAQVQKANNIVIVGGGFIGIEIADELLKLHKKVTVIEMLPSLLSKAMDKEFGDMAVAILQKGGAAVMVGTKVKEIRGRERVEEVVLENGQRIKADLVVVSAGYRPNLEISKKLELEVDEKYGIKVDEYLRTSKKDIFAVGDCVRKRCSFTGEYSNIMLASTAMAHGRLVGSNLFNINVVRGIAGTLGTFSTKVGNTAFGVSGLTESRAQAIGLEYVVGTNETVDRHPAKLPGSSKIYTKLIFSRYSHVLLGVQIRGGDSVGELINMYSVIIQNRMTDMEIDVLQIGTHPLLTSSPVAYSVINATVDSIMKWYNKK